MWSWNDIALRVLRWFGLINSDQPAWLVLAALRMSALTFGFNYLLRLVVFGSVDLWHETVVWVTIVLPIISLGIFCLGCVATLEKGMRRQAETDALTELGNRRWFRDQMDQRIARGARGLFLYVDADHFKSVNDRYGHGAGNDCLRALAEQLRGVMQPGDLAARIGGEEFALFLADRTPHELPMLAATLCSGAMLDTEQGSPIVTCSVGAHVMHPGESYESLCRAADTALYRAKNQGRARMVLARDGGFTDIGCASPTISAPLARRSSDLPPETLADDARIDLGPVGLFLERIGLLTTYSPTKHMVILGTVLLVLYGADLIVRGLLLGEVQPARQIIIEITIGSPYILLMQAAVAYMVRLRDELQVQAERDPLTGLLNRRSFLARADQELPGTLILVDADYFKSVNDTYGHDIGDDCLIELADHLRGVARDEDAVGRLGGEEFALFLPQLPMHRGRALETQLCAGVMLTPPNGAPLRITLSAGAVRATKEQGLEAALSQADRALYLAKSSGRGRMEEAAEAA